MNRTICFLVLAVSCSISSLGQKLIATIPVGTTPMGVALNPKTNRVYVSNFGNNSVSVIDGSSNSVITTVGVGKGPEAILTYAPANLVYVYNSTDSTISVINGLTNTVQSTAAAPPITEWAEVGQSKYVYASNWRANVVNVIDITKLKIVAKISVNDPWFITVNPTTKIAYVTDEPQYVIAIDTTSNMVINSFTVGTSNNVGFVSVDPVNNLLYVATTPIGGDLQYAVSIVDSGSNTLLGTTVPLGALGPVQALTPARDAVLAGGPSNNSYYPDTAVFINGETYNVINELTVGNSPSAMCYHQGTKTLYIANSGSNTVSVISYP